jgi:hypothetical protein
MHQAWMFHESLAATTDMVILPGVLGCRPLRRTVQVRLGTNTLRLPGGTTIFAVSRQQFMKYPGYYSLQFCSMNHSKSRTMTHGAGGMEHGA